MAGIAPAIRVPDMAKAVAFYCDQLGFKPSRELGPDHNSLARGESGLMLESLKDWYAPAYNAAIRERMASPGAMALYIQADDVDELHDRLVAAGIAIVDPVADRPWGQREFTVADPWGTWLCFWRRSSPA